MRRVWLASFALLATSCGTELRSRIKGVRTVIAEARENGAYKCAPVELALAESHADFTDDELDYGNYFGARSELEVADKNAHLAFDKSPKEKCAVKVAIVEPKKIVPLDRDGDGVLDKDDECPDVPGPPELKGCPDTDKDGILDKDDKCPKDPGPKENDGCPWPDRDKDGILDKDDKCPDEPGPKENDGCPDKDRDNDTVVDRLDKCPDTPGPPDNDGCPKYNLIVVTKEKIELKEKVHFKTDKYTILSDSFAMLDEVADVLTKNTAIEVRVEGHTDSRASLKHNMKLSQNRANSVKDYLVKKGVPDARMTAVGYGPTQPIDDNRTAIGRENNRRVEFFITKQ
jgi:outer membrane protein OmpA-like peptidoglycan-associated protein